MKTGLYLVLVTFASYIAGCSTVAPTELVNARSAYQIASEGPARQLVPAELHKAHESLNLAEQSFLNEPDSYKTRDLAYVAQRKAEQAGALGSIAAAKAGKDRANADFQMQQTELMKQGKKDLRDAEKRTADAESELAKQAAINAVKEKADADSQLQQAEIAQGKRDLNNAEKRAAETRADLDKQAALQAAKDKADVDSRKQQADILQGQQDLRDSEKRTSDALASLAALASLNNEKRGLVLMLSGSVLFRSADANLLPAARVKLDQVAKALPAIHARNLIIEGHTDSRGSETYNQDLSQRRADAVRDYLVQIGYQADLIRSLGRGEGSPVANNASAEGRANNRRVEIVIEREKQASN